VTPAPTATASDNPTPAPNADEPSNNSTTESTTNIKPVALIEAHENDGIPATSAAPLVPTKTASSVEAKPENKFQPQIPSKPAALIEANEADGNNLAPQAPKVVNEPKPQSGPRNQSQPIAVNPASPTSSTGTQLQQAGAQHAPRVVNRPHKVKLSHPDGATPKPLPEASATSSQVKAEGEQATPVEAVKLEPKPVEAPAEKPNQPAAQPAPKVMIATHRTHRLAESQPTASEAQTKAAPEVDIQALNDQLIRQESAAVAPVSKSEPTPAAALKPNMKPDNNPEPAKADVAKSSAEAPAAPAVVIPTEAPATSPSQPKPETDVDIAALSAPSQEPTNASADSSAPKLNPGEVYVDDEGNVFQG
jgi:hypothetical protein